MRFTLLLLALWIVFTGIILGVLFLIDMLFIPRVYIGASFLCITFVVISFIVFVRSFKPLRTHNKKLKKPIIHLFLIILREKERGNDMVLLNLSGDELRMALFTIYFASSVLSGLFVAITVSILMLQRLNQMGTRPPELQEYVRDDSFKVPEQKFVFKKTIDK